MKFCVIFSRVALAAALAVLLTGCGGAGGGGTTTTTTSGGGTTTTTTTTGGGGTTTTTTTPYLVSITVTTASSILPVGYSEQMIAIGYYSNGSTVDLTPSATWSSSSPAVASVSTAGVAAAVSPNANSNITATYGGVTSSSYTLWVNTASLLSIAITPVNPILAGGQFQQMAATGTFSNGSTVDITTSLTWASSNYTVASVVDPSLPQTGLVTALSPGVATISAIDPSTGIQASDIFTVYGYAVSGTLWEVPAGASIGLLDNGTDALTVTNGTTSAGMNLPFMFASGVASGSPYTITVASQPAGATHTCNVVDGTGVIAASAMSSAKVVCGTATGTLAGNATASVGSYISGGYADGAGVTASFNNPSGVAYDARTGNVYIADTTNQVIRMVTPAGVVTTVAGTVGFGGFTNGIGTAATFFKPTGVAVDTSGNIYVADTGNNAIRKITMPGATVTTLAGSGAAGANNATGSSATFNAPTALAVDGSGNVLVADTGNSLIRLVGSAGATSTFAGVIYTGTGSACPTFSNGTISPAKATFCRPQGIVTDATHANVYVADTGFNQIRLITGGNASTVAGSTQNSFGAGYADGVGTAAKFNGPIGITLDAAGNLYIGDTGNNLIRKITAPSTTSATVTTYAGTTGSGYILPGHNDGPAWIDGSAYSSSFNGNMGVTVDAAGNVYVADAANQLIRVILP